jgi:hypothetical protein
MALKISHHLTYDAVGVSVVIDRTSGLEDAVTAEIEYRQLKGHPDQVMNRLAELRDALTQIINEVG